MTNDNRTVGELIHDARTKLDLSLRDVTRQLGITPSYLSDIENDRRVPSEEVVRQLATLLKLDADDLLARAGRFGDDAVRYMQRMPAAGVLFRKLADAKSPSQTLEKLIGVVDDEVANKKKKKERGR